MSPLGSPLDSSSTTTPDDNANPHRVLLLLDAQHALLRDPHLGGVPSSPTLRKHLHEILTAARAARPHPPLIIHVRNSGDVGEPDEPHTPGWELYFAPAAGEPVLDKIKNNAFAGTGLGALVPDRAELVVVGMQSDFCVRATCSAALGRGNEVLLIRGAHATYDRLEVLYGGGFTPAGEIEREIEEELEEAGVVVLEMKDVRDIFEDR